MGWRRIWWAVFVIAMAVYATMLVWTLPGIAEDAGGLAAFDMRPTGYTVTEGRAFLAAIGPEGLALYTGPQRLLDIAYPPLLALTLIGGVVMLFQDPRWRLLLCAAALGGMAADLTENIRVAGLLEGMPTDAMIEAASRATLAKSMLTTLAMTGVLVGLLRAGWRRWRPS